MASSELLDLGDEGIVVFEVVHEVRELPSLHVVAAGIEVVVGGGEGI